MRDGSKPITVDVVAAIQDLDAGEWDHCAGQHGPDANPFVSYAFLAALEDSGSVGGDSGWIPRHLAIRQDGCLAACAPLYLKLHSNGEYIFDWSWAEAFRRAGGEYYPKLLCAVPFTPATGPRLLIHPEADQDAMTRALASAMIRLTEDNNLSSAHINFLPKDQWNSLGDMGLLQRITMQFFWHNDGYGSFDDFLDALSSRKRKAIRKERREVAESGVEIRTLFGPEITPAIWDRYFRFYLNTSDRKWGDPYLNRKFFHQLGEGMGERVALILAFDDDEPVAGALNLLGGDCLFGRYWGCTSRFKFLHFELCYYRAIELAIDKGLTRVEAGAQGEHKIQRGYLPHPTYSAHWIPDPGFRRAVNQYLDHEREAMLGDIEELTREKSPFRKDG